MDLSLKLTSNYDEIVKCINDINTRITDYDEKLEKLTPTSAAGQGEVAALTSEFSIFKKYVWKTLSLFKSHLELLALGHDRHEVHLRKKLLLFHGITEENNEKPLEVALKLIVNDLGLSDMSNNDIQVCHRLGLNQAKPRPLLIRFKDYNCRQLVWNHKTALKNSGITITEFLTKSRHRIFMEARKHFGMKSCWSSDGKIVILLPDKSRRRIEVMSELEQLISQHPLQAPVKEDIRSTTVPSIKLGSKNTVRSKRK